MRSWEWEMEDKKQETRDKKLKIGDGIYETGDW